MNEIKKLLIYYKTGIITKEECQKKLQLFTKKDSEQPTEIKKPVPVQNNIQQKVHPLLYAHQIQKRKEILAEQYIKHMKKQAKKKQEIIVQPEISKEERDKMLQERKNRVKFLNSIMKDDKAIRLEQAKYISELLQLNPIERLNKLRQSISFKTFNAEHNHSEKVSLLDGFIVKKEIEHSSMGNHMFWNEVNSLKKLLPYNTFPKLIAYDSYNLVIYMSYCGGMLTPKNLPKDWRNQLEKIKEYLYEADVNSNDMILRNTCVLDGRIYIIDFGMNSIYKKDVAHSIRNLYHRMSSLENRRR